MIRVLVIHYETAATVERASRLRAEGFDAAPYLSLGAKGFGGIRASPPDAIVIDLTRMPSYGKAMGALLRESKALRTIPLVFIEGDPAKAAIVREILPDAVYTAWSNVRNAIDRAVKRPPKTPMAPRPPVRSLPAKLGIGAASVVAVLHAPEGFELQGVPCQQKVDHATIVMFFARSVAALGRELPALARIPEKGRRLWVVWPKQASQVKSDLTLVRICEMAAPYGLAASKVCAIDATWSGIALGRSRQ